MFAYRKHVTAAKIFSKACTVNIHAVRGVGWAVGGVALLLFFGVGIGYCKMTIS